MLGSQPSRYDIAIIGGGLIGSLLALALRRHRPDLAVTLIESDPQFGGRRLESCIADEIPAPLRDIVAPLVVKSWPGCFVNLPQRTQRFADTVMLVDPRQIHLEIVDHPQAAHCHAGSAVSAIARNRIVHARGQAEARMIIDACDARVQSSLGIERMTRYRDFNLTHDLALPILADMSETAGEWSFLQLFPVDGERMVVEHFRHRRRDDAAAAEKAARPGSAIVLGDAAAELMPPSQSAPAAVHFPSLLQIAAEMAAVFVGPALDDDDAARDVFAERMASARHRVRRMFDLADTARSADGPGSA